MEVVLRGLHAMRAGFSPSISPAVVAILKGTTSCVVLFAVGVWLMAPYETPSFALASFPTVVAVAAMFTISHLSEIHISLGKERATISMAEVPMAIALVFVNPWLVIGARLIALFVGYAARRRPIDRVIYNIGLFAFEIPLAFRIADAIGGSLPMPETWHLTIVAMLIANGIGCVLTFSQIAWLGCKVPLSVAVKTTLLVLAFVSASGIVGMFLALCLFDSSWTAPIMVLIYTLVAFASFQFHQQSLQTNAVLQVTNSSIESVHDPENVIESLLESAQRVVSAEAVELVQCPEHVPLSTTISNRARFRCHVSSALRPGETALLEFVFDAPGGERACLRLVRHQFSLGKFTKRHVALLEPVVAHAVSRWSVMHLAAENHRAATIDHTTGLGNELWLRETGQVGATAGVLAMVRFPRLTEVKTAFGHSSTEGVLVQAAERLTTYSSGNPGVLAARTGDEVFSVWLPEKHVSVFPELLESLRATYHVDGIAVSTSVVCGFAGVDEGDKVCDAVRQATTALAHAMTTKANHPVDVTSCDASKQRDRVILAADLREAIASEDVFVVYQPKVDPQTGRVRGMEALARWVHKDQGFIPPDVFVEIAEGSHLIGELTSFVLGRALADCAAWQSIEPGLTVAVNVSPTNLSDPDFLQSVETALEMHSLEPCLLTIEMTETAVMHDESAATQTMQSLRQLGCGVSSDDFGTGYSSLLYLLTLPVNEVKIDKSFVMTIGDDLTGQNVVRHMVNMLHSLGMTVVAEGVEDEVTQRFLASVGCDTAQGYHIARPMPQADVSSWLQEQRQSSRL